MSDSLSDSRVEALRRAVRESNAELHAAAANVEKAATDSMQLGTHMARHPWTWLGVACLAGVVIGWRADP